MDGLYSCMYGTPGAYPGSPDTSRMEHTRYFRPEGTHCGYDQCGYGCYCLNHEHVPNDNRVTLGRKCMQFASPPGFMPSTTEDNSLTEFQRCDRRTCPSLLNNVTTPGDNIRLNHLNVSPHTTVHTSHNGSYISTATCQKDEKKGTSNVLGAQGNTNSTETISRTSERLSNEQHHQKTLGDHGEDVDEEDISDDDEAEQCYKNFIDNRLSEQRAVEDGAIVKDLLGFAQMVSGDINRYFGKKEGRCDIYEHKWVSGKSGRDLYYSDLLKIAQGDFDEERSKDKERNKKENLKPSHAFSKTNSKQVEDKRKGETGSELGPLAELFHAIVKEMESCKSVKSGMDNMGIDEDQEKCSKLSMHKRKFPNSFWEEPAQRPEKHIFGKRRCNSEKDGFSQSAVMNTVSNTDPEYSFVNS